MTAMKVDHFYHVYADGQWQEPVDEHLLALSRSGLGANLNRMMVGYVGSPERIAEAEAYVQSHVDCVTLNRAESGWEQETMRHIQANLSDCPVFYAHTKGASDSSAINVAWRRSMTWECVIRWKNAMTALEDHDAVGCHWLTASDGGRFFGGTFWWATPQYLATLPPVGEDNRWAAEGWIGMNPEVRVFDLKPGHPGMIPLDTDWRYVDSPD